MSSSDSATGTQPRAPSTATGPQHGAHGLAVGRQRDLPLAQVEPTDLTALATGLRQLMMPQTAVEMEHWRDDTGKNWSRKAVILLDGVSPNEARHCLHSLEAMMVPATGEQIRAMLKRIFAHYPTTRRSGDLRGAADDWVSIFTREPIGPLIMAYEEYLCSPEEWAPTPGKLLALVHPHAKRLSGKIKALRGALTEQEG